MRAQYVYALGLLACQPDARTSAELRGTTARPVATGAATDATSGPTSSANHPADVREPPAAVDLPATRSLGAGIRAAWLDDHHAIFWETTKNDVVSVDVRNGRREVLSDFVGTTLVAADGIWATTNEFGQVFVHDSSGERLWERDGGGGLNPEHVTKRRRLALEITSHGLTTATGDLLRSLDLKGNARWEQARDVSDLAASRDGRWLAVRSFDDPVVVLRAADGAVERTLDGVVCAMEFSPDGSKLALAVASPDAKLRLPRGPTIIYDTSNWAPLLKIGGRGGCGGIAFSPDGNRVAVHGDELLSVWTLGTTDAVAWTVPTGRLAGWEGAGLLLEHSREGIVLLAL